MLNKQRLIKLTQKLIQINSENPPGNEFKIACFVREYLKNLGLKTKVYEFAKKRTNVVAVLNSMGTAPALRALSPKKQRQSLLITPHLDTVPAGKNWTVDPFQGIIRRKRIYGLGATDCKGNLAVGLEVIRSLVEDKFSLGYNLIFAATADEENGSSLGLELLLNRGILKPDAALVLDADDFSIVVAQKGLIHMKIKIEGKKAHGAYPWLGANAIDTAIDVIKKIKAYQFSESKNKYLRGPTINLGTIRGGDKVNVVADWCEVELDLRFLPGDRAKKILADIEDIVKHNARKFSRRGGIPQSAVKIEIEGIQQPFSIAGNHRLVDCLTRTLRSLKIKPVLEGSEGATVISFFQEKKIPSLATGFGAKSCAHMADEYVEIDSLYRGAMVLDNFLKNYGGKLNGRN